MKKLVAGKAYKNTSIGYKCKHYWDVSILAKKNNVLQDESFNRINTLDMKFFLTIFENILTKKKLHFMPHIYRIFQQGFLTEWIFLYASVSTMS